MSTVYWITGLSGSGKTTIASLFHGRITKIGRHALFLDGDEMRQVLDVTQNSHTPEERLKLALTYSRLCKLIASQGYDVVCSTISMFHKCHLWNRENLTKYIEIYLKVPIDILIQRDSKGIYRKIEQGKIKNVMGIDIEIEEPNDPNIIINNDGSITPEEIVDIIISKFV